VKVERQQTTSKKACCSLYKLEDAQRYDVFKAPVNGKCGVYIAVHRVNSESKKRWAI